MEQAIYSAFAWRSAVHNSGLESAAGPESPRLFVPPSLPETPPAQKLQIATSAPPVRRTRSIIPPPAASHPVLTSAFAVAGTGAPDISQAPTRLPTQRQLQLGPMFAFPLLPGPQEPIPFPSSASDTKPASLLEKVNSLPGPKDMLRSIIAERHNSLSLQDSSMLSDMLRRSAPLHTDTEAPVAANSAGSAYRYWFMLCSHVFLCLSVSQGQTTHTTPKCCHAWTAAGRPLLTTVQHSWSVHASCCIDLDSLALHTYHCAHMWEHPAVWPLCQSQQRFGLYCCSYRCECICLYAVKLVSLTTVHGPAGQAAKLSQ